MPSRMDKYRVKPDKQEEYSRISKNSNLYDDMMGNAKYTEYVGINEANVVDLSGINDNPTSREEYKRARDADAISEDYRSNDNMVNIEEPVKKVYDINTVLEEARKNRKDDEDEVRRKIKNERFSILTQIDNKEKEVSDKNNSGLNKEEEEELQTLVDSILDGGLGEQIKDNLDKMNEVESKKKDEEEQNTIERKLEEDLEKTISNLESTISNLSSDEIKELSPVTGDLKDASLLDDLMPNSNTETIITDKISNTLLEIEMNHKDEKENIETTKDEIEAIENTMVDNVEKTTIDRSFYTGSTEITKDDIEEEGTDMEFVEQTNPVIIFVKILVILILLAIIGVIIYILVKKF